MLMKCENGNPSHLDYDSSRHDRCPECPAQGARPKTPPIQPDMGSQSRKAEPILPPLPPTTFFWNRAAPGIAAEGGARELFDPVTGWLVVVDGPGQGKEYPIFLGENTVGRLPSHTVFLEEDTDLSRELHFTIFYDYDLKSFSIKEEDPERSKTRVYLEQKPKYKCHPDTGDPLVTQENGQWISTTGDPLGKRRLGSKEEVDLKLIWRWDIKVGKTTLAFVPFCDPTASYQWTLQ